MSENTDIVASNARRHKPNQEIITATPKNANVMREKKKEKIEMERNKYIMSSMNKTQKWKLQEWSLKKKNIVPLEGCE